MFLIGMTPTNLTISMNVATFHRLTEAFFGKLTEEKIRGTRLIPITSKTIPIATLR